MKLPDLVLPSRVNQTWQYSGMDSPELCANLEHFQRYPHHITYQYNSRGFRDSEWPHDFDSAIWCIGDSFTVGLGLPQDHTWPHQLSKKLQQSTINISMDGASNQWIARRVQDIMSDVAPQSIIIQWSYLHRREATVAQVQEQQLLNLYADIKDTDWPHITSLKDFDSLPSAVQNEVNMTPCRKEYLEFWFQVSDESRRLHHATTTNQQDIDCTLDCIKQVQQHSCRVIHTFVPNFGTADLDLNREFFSKLDEMKVRYLPEIQPNDSARDGHHYGIATVDYLTDQLVEIVR